MAKKGDLSINIIVIAAIALLILVIIAVLLIRSGGQIRDGTSCSGLGGSCEESCADIVEDGIWIPNPTAECPTGQICCVRQGGLTE